MKNYNTKFLFTCLILLGLASSNLFGQNNTIKQINAPTEDIFIQNNLDVELPDHLKRKYETLVRLNKVGDDHLHEGHDHDAQTDESLLLAIKEAYLIDIYQNANGAPKDAPTAAPLCDNGGFEFGDFTHFGGDTAHGTVNGYSFGEENSIPNAVNFSNHPPQVSGAPDNFLLMGIGNDPLVTAFGGTLSQVHTDSFSARLNGPVPTNTNNTCYHNREVSKLSKTAVLPEGTDRIDFSFAFIAENPDGHVNRQPYFLARALNTSGEELDRTWRVSDGSDFFFELNGTMDYLGCNVENIVYSDWTCDGLYVGDEDTVIIEFITADCGAGGHFSYAYVDDICVDCVNDDPCEFKGYLEMDPRAPCMFFPTQVCGTYEPPVFACTEWPMTEVVLEFVHDMAIVSTTPIIGTIDATDGTYCFNINESLLPAGFETFDFQVTATFSDGISDYELEDVHSNPGQNNDLDIACCPEVCIECCTLYGPCLCDEINSDDQLIYVWATDCNGTVLNNSDYNLQWSDGTSGTIATTTIFEEISVTIDNPIDSCTSVDTFLLMCCDSPFLEINIIWPGNKECDTSSQAIVYLEDTFSNTVMLNAAPYVYEWNDGATTNFNWYDANTEVWVVVTDTSTGCMWTDTFFHCCDTINFELVHCLSDLDDNNNPAPGQATTSAAGLSTSAKSKLRTMIHYKSPSLSTSQIKAMIDEVDDCEPCLQDSILVFVIDPITLLPVSTGDGYDFEWSDGTTGDISFLEPGETLWVTITDPNSCADPWSDTITLECCNTTIPTDLNTGFIVYQNGNYGAQVSWDQVPDASGYIIEYYNNDPSCCNTQLAGGPQQVLSPGTLYTFSQISNWCCFSWKVRARCDNGELSPWSETICVNNYPTNVNCGPIIWPPVIKKPVKSLDLDGAQGVFDLNASPNPAKDVVTFSFGENIPSFGSIKLFDVTGKTIKEIHVEGESTISTDISEFSKGVYFFHFTDNTINTESEKLIIE